MRVTQVALALCLGNVTIKCDSVKKKKKEEEMMNTVTFEKFRITFLLKIVRNSFLHESIEENELHRLRYLKKSIGRYRLGLYTNISIYDVTLGGGVEACCLDSAKRRFVWVLGLQLSEVQY